MTDNYAITRKEFFLGKELKHGEPDRNTFIRLAKKKAGKQSKWKRPVHEVWNVSGKTKILNEPLEHYSARSVTQFVIKLNNYTDRNAAYLFEQGVHTSWFAIIAYPKAKFIKNYFLKQGFRDGTHGFLHATFMSMHSFLTRAKLWLLWNKSTKTL